MPLERTPNARNDLHGQQGVPAELEEIIVDADAVDPEDVGEDAAEGLFRGVARRDIAVSDLSVEIGRGKGAAIDLAIGRQGQRVERDESRGDHIVGQLAREGSAQLRDLQSGSFGGDHIGDEALVAAAILACDDHGLAQLRQACERGLDLAELDAEAADLHLMVDASEELDVSIGAVAGEIAGPVEPFAGVAEGIGNETLGGEIGAPEIAARQPCAADVKLARDADRDGLRPWIEQIDLRVGDRTADRHVLVLDFAQTRIDGYID
ncbi:hypothetical+protein [Methylocapsa aurea]